MTDALEQARRQFLMSLHDWALTGRIAVHIENTDLNGMRGLPVGIAISTKPGSAAYIPVGHSPELGGAPQLSLEDVLAALKPVLEDAKVQKVTHNGHFDFLIFANHGVTMRGMRFDTMIAVYLLGESNMSIQSLAFDRLKMKIPPLIDIIGRAGKKQLTMSQIATEVACDYCCRQVDARGNGAADLFRKQLPLPGVINGLSQNPRGLLRRVKAH